MGGIGDKPPLDVHGLCDARQQAIDRHHKRAHFGGQVLFLDGMQFLLGALVDLGRQHIPAPQRYYSWWSYRNPGWQENDKGRRLDHMWASPEVARQARAHRVLEDARAWEQPSDHVPLITEFDL